MAIFHVACASLDRLMLAIERPSNLDTAMIEHLEQYAQECWNWQPDVLGFIALPLLEEIFLHIEEVTALLGNSRSLPYGNGSWWWWPHSARWRHKSYTLLSVFYGESVLFGVTSCSPDG